jgi:hypothetical protein
MTGIQFVTDEMGRKVAVQIDLKRYGAVQNSGPLCNTAAFSV